MLEVLLRCSRNKLLYLFYLVSPLNLLEDFSYELSKKFEKVLKEDCKIVCEFIADQSSERNTN